MPEDMSGSLVEAVQRTADCAFRNVAEWVDKQGEDNVVVAGQEEDEEEDIHRRLAYPWFLTNYSRMRSPLFGVVRDEEAPVQNYLDERILNSREPSLIDVRSLNWCLDTIHHTEGVHRLSLNLLSLQED